MGKVVTILFLCFVLATTSVANDNGETGSSHVSRLSGKIVDMPDGEGYMLLLEIYDNSESMVLASTSVSADGSFDIELPFFVDANYTKPMADGKPESISLSNNDLRFAFGHLGLYDENGAFIDTVTYLGKSEDDSVFHFMGELWYADIDCDITGFVADIQTSNNIALKKGWNWVFYTVMQDYSQTINSVVPSEMRFRLMNYSDQ